MSNNYTDGTGLLMLKDKTPVIEALFGGWSPEPSTDHVGCLNISTRDEESDWDGVRERLVTLATQLELSIESAEDASFEALILAVGKALGVKEAPELEHLLEHESFEDWPCLDSLFVLAQYLDDGHGLTAVSRELAWTADKYRPWNFGGMFSYTSIPYEITVSTEEARVRTENIAQAINTGDDDAVARALLPFAMDALQFTDVDQRARIKAKLAELIAQAA